MGNYVDADYLTALGIDISSLNAAQIAARIAEAEALVETLTGNKFYDSTQTVRFDGNGKRNLFFAPKIALPLISATSVTIVDPSDNYATLDNLTEGTDFTIDAEGHYMETADEDSSTIRSWLGYGTWPRGLNNVEVVGSWGVSTCPADIKLATSLLVATVVHPDFSGLGQVISMRWPDLAITKASSAMKIPSITGYPTIDAILSKHKPVGNVMMAP